jgi:hypothetical protein
MAGILTIGCASVQAQLSSQVVTGTPVPQMQAGYAYGAANGYYGNNAYYGNAGNYGNNANYGNSGYYGPNGGYGSNYYGPSGSIPAPIIQSSEPRNGDSGVNASLRKITITFNQAMNAGSFYWQVPKMDRSFPQMQGDPYWTNGNRTLVMQVILYPGTQYRIPINISGPVFVSASGVPAAPGYLSFQTGLTGGSSVPLNAIGRGGTVKPAFGSPSNAGPTPLPGGYPTTLPAQVSGTALQGTAAGTSSAPAPASLSTQAKQRLNTSAKTVR